MNWAVRAMGMLSKARMSMPVAAGAKRLATIAKSTNTLAKGATKGALSKASTLEKGIATSVEAYGDKHPLMGKALKLITSVGATLGLGWAIDKVFGSSKDSLPPNSDEMNILRDAADEEWDEQSQLKRLRRISHGNEDEVYSTNKTSAMKAMVMDRLFRHGSLTGNWDHEVTEGLFVGLSNWERMLLLQQLVTVCKEVVVASSADETWNLIFRMMALSSAASPVPAQGFDRLVSHLANEKTQYEILACQLNSALEGCVEEIQKHSARAVFDEASTMWDLFDLLNRKSVADVDPTVMHEFELANLFVGFRAPDYGSWFDKFITDSSGDDDESRAKSFIFEVASVSDKWFKICSNIVNDNSNSAEYALNSDD